VIGALPVTVSRDPRLSPLDRQRRLHEFPGHASVQQAGIPNGEGHGHARHEPVDVLMADGDAVRWPIDGKDLSDQTVLMHRFGRTAPGRTHKNRHENDAHLFHCTGRGARAPEAVAQHYDTGLRIGLDKWRVAVYWRDSDRRFLPQCSCCLIPCSIRKRIGRSDVLQGSARASCRRRSRRRTRAKGRMMGRRLYVGNLPYKSTDGN
jgi:hypothetical protein